MMKVTIMVLERKRELEIEKVMIKVGEREGIGVGEEKKT